MGPCSYAALLRLSVTHGSDLAFCQSTLGGQIPHHCLSPPKAQGHVVFNAPSRISESFHGNEAVGIELPDHTGESVQ